MAPDTRDLPRRLPRTLVAALLSAMAGVAALLKIRSYDVWWHLETGRLILSQRSIPSVDDFSFTSRGAAWVDHEWLFQVILFLAHAAAGPWGIAILKAACVLVVGWIGYRALCASGAAGGVALGVVGLAIAGLRFRLGERPETVSMALACVCAAVALSLLCPRTQDRSPAGRLALFALVTILWANMHASALLAPVLAGACAAGGLVAPRGTGPSRSAARAGAMRALAAAGIGAAALLCNPYGWRIYGVPLEISRALEPANLVNPEWSAPTLATFPLFFASVALAGVAVLQALRRGPPLAGARAALWCVGVSIGLLSVRHVGLFFAVLPLMIDAGALPAPAPFKGRSSAWQAAGIALALAAVTWMIFRPPAGAETGIGIMPDRYPEKAADFLDASLAEARLYNDVSFGGYLIWRGYPRRRVFIDGRNEVHAPLLREISAALDDGRRWSALLDGHEVEGAVVGYRDEAVPVRDAVSGAISTSTFSDLHFPRGAWALVYWDDVAMVFLRRTGRYAREARRLEYPLSHPESWRLRAATGGIFEAQPGIAEEIRRKLAQDQDCRLAKAMARVYGVAFTTSAR